MTRAACPCCNQARPVAALLRRRALTWDGAWRPDLSRAPGRHPLCGSCALWLGGVLLAAQQDESPRLLFGSPTPSSRALVFHDQCDICRTLPIGSASQVDCVAVAQEPRSWPPLFLCGPCDTWMAGLAEDGRSARGGAGRTIDGPYGEWPHPNLRELKVELEVVDAATRAVILSSCAAMAVSARPGAVPASGAVLMVEVTAGSSVAALVRGSRASRPAVIAVAALEAQAELREALDAGASGWLTSPVTPQQVTAALTAAMRRTSRRAWDPETCLPIASIADARRPMLVLTPEPGVSRFEVAWFARRFSRGYDELALAGGHIVLVPKAPPERLSDVRLRLSRLLAGRCTLVELEAPSLAPRFDAAG